MTQIKRNNLNQAPYFFDSYLLKDLLNWPERSQNIYRNEGNGFPAVNVRESESQFLVEVAAPGLKKDSFSIQLEKNLLTISAMLEGNKEETNENGRYTLREFSPKSFSRSFKLQEDKIDSEKIEASYLDGILRLVLPKKEEKAEKVKKIEVL